MKITVKSDLKPEAQEMPRRRNALLSSVKRMVRSVSFELERNVKNEMPVDTGRARASWGHWTPGDLRGPSDARASDAVWKETDDGLTIEQGSNVEYIAGLNDGSSKQAPRGFLDVLEERAVDLLDARVDDIMRSW